MGRKNEDVNRSKCSIKECNNVVHKCIRKDGTVYFEKV